MRIVATEYVSLDGVFEEPGHWSGPWFDDQAAQFKFAELQASDALLLGRKTYEGFAAAWPRMEGTGEFGEKMNEMPKFVVSTTLENPEWNNTTVLKGDLEEEVGKLKQQFRSCSEPAGACSRTAETRRR
jgi:dihydrofolate reductase